MEPTKLDEIVARWEDKLARCPKWESRRDCLTNLANALDNRFKISGMPHDIDLAITYQRQAVELCGKYDVEYTRVVGNLSLLLFSRFHRLGKIEDLEEAIEYGRTSLARCPRGHEGRSQALSCLAAFTETRFEHCGSAEDIDSAIELHREALELRAVSHTNRPNKLNNLAGAIRRRFTQRGAAEDVDEAIQLHREALALCPSAHPDRALSLNNLATALGERFAERGAAEDIDEAIQLLHETCVILSADSSRAVSLNNLASALHARFQQRGAVKDIDEAIEVSRKALVLRPVPHPDRAKSLNALAVTITRRFWNRQAAEDLDEGIQLHREAIALCAPRHADRALFLNSFARTISLRSTRGGGAKDIDEAIAAVHEALALCPHPHPNRATSLPTLGTLLLLAAEVSANGAPHASGATAHPPVDEAIRAFQEASGYVSASPLTRLRMAENWARVAYEYHHISALPAFQRAIELLPEVAALSLDLQSRQKMLESHSNNLASDAAICAIDLGEHELAVEFLEAGRSLIWSQSLHLRTSLDDLRDLHPELATKLARMSQQLEQNSFQDTSRDFQSDSQQKVLAMEEEELKIRHINNEWIQTVDAVRVLPGFENFLRPKSISQLRLAATRGPVVILTAGKSASHALILHPSGTVECIPLPRMRSRDFVKSLAELVDAITSSSPTFNLLLDKVAKRDFGLDSAERLFGLDSAERLLGRKVYLKNRNPLECLRAVLTLMFVGIVDPVISESSLKLERSEKPPRLWWCPTGPFAFLPIHAAGLYHVDPMVESLADYVVSSYTPTLTAMLSPTHPAFGPNRPPKVTAVAQPNTTSYAWLAGTISELRKIEEKVPEEWRKDTIFESPPDIDRVLQHLHTSSIVHFACHGVQNTTQPLLSALLIADERLTVSQIMQLSGVSQNTTPTDMGLAFLSACQTATGDRNVPDEALHLAATLLFAGYRSVVATMWTMTDSDGPKVAEEFYGHLFRNANPNANPAVYPDLNESAEALHLAVKKLRDSNVPLLQWIPFVHYGV